MKRLVFLTAARQVWGAEESLLSIAAECSRRGMPTALVCFGGEVAERFAAVSPGPVYQVRNGAPEHERKLHECMTLWSLYWRNARADDALAIFSYYLAVPTLAFRPMARLRRIRIGLDLHDNLPRSRGRVLLRQACRGVDAVTACSRFTGSQVDGHPRVAAIHGPVDDRPYAPAADAGDTMRVGIVGRIATNKRHDLVIEAVSRCDDSVVLVVRGDGDGSELDNSVEVRRRGAEVLGPRFDDQGRVPAAEALSDLEVVVVANPAEPMGRTVLEAQLQGVVAVVPDTGGASELVEDGVTGFVYRADDADDLARVLTSVRNHPHLEQVRRSGRDAVVSGDTLPVRYTEAYLTNLA